MVSEGPQRAWLLKTQNGLCFGLGLCLFQDVVRYYKLFLQSESEDQFVFRVIFNIYLIISYRRVKYNKQIKYPGFYLLFMQKQFITDDIRVTKDLHSEVQQNLKPVEHTVKTFHGSASL